MNINRGLFYFILFDLIVAVAIIVHFNSENNEDNISQHNQSSSAQNYPDNKIASNTVALKDSLDKNELEISENNIALGTSFSQESNKLSLIIESTPNKAVAQVSSKPPKAVPLCVTYGPLDLQEKSSLDVILNKYVPNFYSNKNIIVTKVPLLEIDWNLGKDKVVAMDIFEKQKNDGALQDERFKLSKSVDGEWIIPVSTVAATQGHDLAKKMVADLGASSSMLGGKWQYKPRADGYFYQFKNITNLPNNAINAINSSISALKTPCH